MFRVALAAFPSAPVKLSGGSISNQQLTVNLVSAGEPLKASQPIPELEKYEHGVAIMIWSSHKFLWCNNGNANKQESFVDQMSWLVLSGVQM